MLAEWQNEYGSDPLILMRGRSGGREDVFGSGVVSSATRFCLSIRLLFKMYYSGKMSRVNDTVSRMSRIRRFQGSFYKEILAA